MKKIIVFTVFALLLCASSFAGDRYVCTLDRCFLKVLSPAEQDQVFGTEQVPGVVLSRPDLNTGSDYRANYTYAFIPNVSPAFVASVFTRFKEHKDKLNPPIRNADERIFGSEDERKVRGGQAEVEYTLDISAILSGLGSFAPISKYVVIENISQREDGSWLIEWKIDAEKTAKLYEPEKKPAPKPEPTRGFWRGLKKLGGAVVAAVEAGVDAVSMENKGRPEYIHGYFLVEEVPAFVAEANPSRNGVIITYANYIIPDSKMLGDTVNENSTKALEEIARRTIAWIEAEAISQGPETQRESIQKMCARFFL